MCRNIRKNSKFLKQNSFITVAGHVFYLSPKNITIQPNSAILSCVYVAAGRAGCTVEAIHCRGATAAALIQSAIKGSAEVNLFTLCSAQYTIDLGGSMRRETYALITNSIHLVATW